MLENREFDEYASKVFVTKSEINRDVTKFKHSTEDKDSQRTVILEKLWRLSRVVGDHYIKCLGSIAELETELGETETVKQLEHQMEANRELLGLGTSDTPSVVTKSDPSPQNLLSLS